LKEFIEVLGVKDMKSFAKLASGGAIEDPKVLKLLDDKSGQLIDAMIDQMSKEGETEVRLMAVFANAIMRAWVIKIVDIETQVDSKKVSDAQKSVKDKSATLNWTSNEELALPLLNILSDVIIESMVNK